MASQIDESSPSHDEGKRIEFRDELRGKIRPVLIKLSDALSQLADAKL
jgi:hypothetical protein